MTKKHMKITNNIVFAVISLIYFIVGCKTNFITRENYYNRLIFPLTTLLLLKIIILLLKKDMTSKKLISSCLFVNFWIIFFEIDSYINNSLLNTLHNKNIPMYNLFVNIMYSLLFTIISLLQIKNLKLNFSKTPLSFKFNTLLNIILSLYFLIKFIIILNY